MATLAILLAGYSLFSAFVIATTHFRRAPFQEQTVSRTMGLVILATLAVLQAAHVAWLQWDQDWVGSPAYRMALFTVAPAFFLFSDPLLRPQTLTTWRPVHWLHLAPMAVSPWLASDVALPTAFAVGAGYLLWLARSLLALRGERANFRLEIQLLGGVFAIAVVVAVLGLFQAALPGKLFYSLYACAIGLAFLLVQIALGLRPQLQLEVQETVQAAYATSTLNNVDCAAVLARLDTLMAVEQVYTDSDLSLPGLAEQCGLSPHQLSELLNARLGKGFARYLREYRVEAAKAMLLQEPSASVLSVGLSVGFTAQSNFYEAFREIAGTTPGQFRKLNSQPRATK